MKLMVGLVAGLSLMLAACSITPPPSPTTVPSLAAARVASPATQNCLQQHGKLVVVPTPEGEVGYCDLPGGKRCEEWDMFRGNCPIRTVNVNMKLFR